MDKNTLSNYGWIVIAVLVLSVMIALATPFGEYIKAGVESTTAGLFDTSEKALNVVGMSAKAPITPDKKTVSGNILAINDVSDTAHNLKVNLSSDTVTDFSGVTVSKYGKNLLDMSTFVKTDDVNPIVERTENSVSFKKAYSPYSGGIKTSIYLPKGKYVLSFNVSWSEGNYNYNAVSVSLKKNGASNYMYQSSGSFHSITIEEADTYSLCIYAPYSAPVGTITTIRNVQLECSTQQTGYVPYTAPQTITANADGIVNGLTSVSPDVTLMTDNDNITITCEYQKKTLTMPLTIRADSMSDGTVLKLEENILKKDQKYTFSADVTSFDAIRIYHGFEENLVGVASVEITQSSINCYNHLNDITKTVEHDLNIKDFIDVSISVNALGKSSLVLKTKDAEFETNVSIGHRGMIQVESTGSDLSNVEFSWSTTEYEKDIWVFGDSWMSLGTDGWTYYLLNQKDNFSVSGYGGGISPYLYNDFVTGLKYDTPKYAVWALGMNEGDSKDSDAINSTWKEYINYFIKKCEENHITPILVTIPSSATINNDNKNEWIRNSGYRYIDFATAMGANNFGTNWTTGLAKSDGNHPTVEGAKVLAQQVLKDFPEIQ